jgi:predicted nuclease of predicted toxin-antitoxin system
LRLLFDQNLSRRLASALADLYPDSTHVSGAGLDDADDEDIWNYAASNAMIIVSKDSDFRHRSFLFGPPPKVIWIARGNCSTTDIEILLRRSQSDLGVFDSDPVSALLVLF